MSTTKERKPSGVELGLRRVFDSLFTGITSRVVETITKRMVMAGIESGLELIVRMLANGQGYDRTIGMLHDMIRDLQKERDEQSKPAQVEQNEKSTPEAKEQEAANGGNL